MSSLLKLRRTAPNALPRTLLVTPPFVQLNTPYPATCYLTGLLAARGAPVAQADLSLETALALFSRSGLARLFAAIRAAASDGRALPDPVARALALEADYLATVEPAIRVLQGRDPTFATRIVQGDALPQGPRFAAAEVDLDWAFGALGTADRARYLATLYLYDLADLVQGTVAPRFGLARYAESLAASAGSFDPLAAALAEPPNLVDELCLEALAAHVARARPEVVGLTAPFPGNVYGALRIARWLRAHEPSVKIVLGGGWVNTELRELDEPRLFALIDFVTLDDGERPLLALLEQIAGGGDRRMLTRTLFLDGDRVARSEGAEPDLAQAELPAPSYRDLPLDRYLSVIEIGNPMHRLWSDGRWNKLTVAHGCYWKRCTFCDTGLDYIGRFEASAASALVDRMDALVAETGQGGFHFVDEAAPPLSLVELALELLARGRALSWWGNIRFEKTFTPDVCRLLAASGCIAVSGGLEVASDRLLELMEKGVTVAQVARVASAFSEAGVMVHAYLMYGFPTETAAETVDALERVRQLFVAGAIQSAFWHRFSLTRHSPIARDPARYRIRVTGPAPGRFANNDLQHDDPEGADPERFGDGLRRAVYNFMHGVGLDRDVRSWFPSPAPRPRVPRDLVAGALAEREAADPDRPSARLAWVGGAARAVAGRRPGIAIVARSDEQLVPMAAKAAAFVVDLLAAARPRAGASLPRRPDVAAAFPGGARAFDRFLASEAGRAVAAAGLLALP